VPATVEVCFSPEDDCAEFAVNSLHEQGIDQLGAGLTVEAIAPDGLIECVRAVEAEAFTVGVQWHPEWFVEENPLNRELLKAFGRACAERAGHLSTRRSRNAVRKAASSPP